VIVLDTTVLAYAVGADAKLAEPNRRLLQAVRDGTVEATTTAEVIQEFAHVYARRRNRAEAVRLGRAYAELLAPLAAVDPRELDDGLSLFEHHRALGAFDAILAAVALAREADALVSADHAFADVPKLRHIDPFLSLDDLLG
jgi:hypothetical protein